MQADSLADIESEFIQGGSLRHHGKVEALGHKLAFAFGDAHLDRSLPRWFTSDYSMRHDCAGPRVQDLGRRKRLPHLHYFAVSSTSTESMASGALAGRVTLTVPPVCFIFNACLASANRYAFFTLPSTLESSKDPLGYLKR